MRIEIEEFKRKDKILLIICMLIGLLVGGLIGNKINEYNTPVVREFEFRGGFVHQGGNYKKSISEVVVNNFTLSDEELLELVYAEYILMHDEPDELTLNLYYSTRALHNNDPFLTKTYIKN